MTKRTFEDMENFEILSQGDLLHGRFLKVSDKAPVVVIATGGSNHGSLGQSWLNLPKLLKSAGISSVVFDFSGQGLSEGNRRVLTIKKGVKNLSDILGHIMKWNWVKDNEIALFGSSYGGNVVLDYLASDETVLIKGATFKSPCIDLQESYLQELGVEGMEKWKVEGYSEITGLDWSAIEQANASDLPQRLHKINIPLLITHGVKDESVSIEQSRFVRDHTSGIVDLFEMKYTNHHYSDGNDWDRMAAIHIAWLKQLFGLE